MVGQVKVGGILNILIILYLVLRFVLMFSYFPSLSSYLSFSLYYLPCHIHQDSEKKQDPGQRQEPEDAPALARLFHYSTPTTMESGGEALIEAGAMEDSLHALVWQD